MQKSPSGSDHSPSGSLRGEFISPSEPPSGQAIGPPEVSVGPGSLPLRGCPLVWNTAPPEVSLGLSPPAGPRRRLHALRIHCPSRGTWFFSPVMFRIFLCPWSFLADWSPESPSDGEMRPSALIEGFGGDFFAAPISGAPGGPRWSTPLFAIFLFSPRSIRPAFWDSSSTSYSAPLLSCVMANRFSPPELFPLLFLTSIIFFEAPVTCVTAPAIFVRILIIGFVGFFLKSFRPGTMVHALGEAKAGGSLEPRSSRPA